MSSASLEDRLEIVVYFKDGEFPRELVLNRSNREVDYVTMDGKRLEDVVRCRDCAYSIHFFHHDDERWQCTEPYQEGDDVKPDAYCWRGKPKEGGE